MVKTAQLVTGGKKLGRAEAQDRRAGGTVLMPKTLECNWHFFSLMKGEIQKRQHVEESRGLIHTWMTGPGLQASFTKLCYNFYESHMGPWEVTLGNPALAQPDLKQLQEQSPLCPVQQKIISEEMRLIPETSVLSAGIDNESGTLKSLGLWWGGVTAQQQVNSSLAIAIDPLTNTVLLNILQEGHPVSRDSIAGGTYPKSPEPIFPFLPKPEWYSTAILQQD